MSTLRLIGYWRNDQHPEYPDPATFVDHAWAEDERHEVSLYLSQGTVVAVFRGWSPCRICGMHNGDREFTDGVYRWPSGLAHYVGDHAVRLPQPVIDHALSRSAKNGEAATSLDWWLEATRP